jgi:universal stress protein E
MQNFHNILFVSQGITDETEALKQALSVARNHGAELKAIILCPEFPKEMADHKEKYESALIEQLQTSIRSTREIVNVSETDVPLQIDVESGNRPAISIVRHVLKNAYDLVIKEAEPKEGGKGFKAMDMELLRKCPCPVWLTRPIQRHHESIRVAVAIDPQSMAPEGHDLSLRLLKLSRSLADTCNGDLSIISCWLYEYENTLRDNAWFKTSEEELQKTVLDTQLAHKAALELVLAESGVGGRYSINHIKGKPDTIIPEFVEEKGIDILVMGTVGRVGLRGFIIGNTAENVLQKVGCSLLALKPNGFVSPIKAY